ncbi:retrovirus-related pol polyprotein from transposon TNT 1-94 [Tanacetum coccineum]
MVIHYTLLIPSIKKSYTQASKHPKWIEAMNNEIYALESNHIWVLTTLPPNKHPIGSKWVFRIKYNANGSVEKYKARLVAKDFTQHEGIDYTETFPPVAKMVTVRTLLAISSINKWFVQQLDINNAFLHGDLNEEVYMPVPSGYKKPLPPNTVCKLKKSIYGPKQANRQWYIKLTTILISLGFIQSHDDSSIFTYYKGSDSLILLIYVDDILLAGNNFTLVSKIKDQLHHTFSIKDLDALHYYLGIEFLRNSNGIISVFVPTLVRVLCDNISTIVLSLNLVQHARTKHIELDCHFVRDKIKAGQIQISDVPTKAQAADIFTKALTTYPYRQCLSKLGMCDPYTLPACRGDNGIHHKVNSKVNFVFKCRASKTEEEQSMCNRVYISPHCSKHQSYLSKCKSV